MNSAVYLLLQIFINFAPSFFSPVTRDGQEFELKAQGWNPLKEETTESEGEKAGE